MKPFMQSEARQLYLPDSDSIWSHPDWADLDPVILARFKAFHEKHPELLDLYIRFAREAKAAGLKHCGMKMIGERARWYAAIEKRGLADAQFVVNNSHLSGYARLVMLTAPDLESFFELRSAHKLLDR